MFYDAIEKERNKTSGECNQWGCQRGTSLTLTPCTQEYPHRGELSTTRPLTGKIRTDFTQQEVARKEAKDRQATQSQVEINSYRSYSAG